MMTNHFARTSVLSLLITSNVLATDALMTKFDKQYIWSPVSIVAEDLYFNGYRTTRNTLRVSPESSIGSVSYNLYFESSTLKTTEDFRSNCRMRSPSKLKNFQKAWLNVKVNPFAKNAELTVKDANGEFKTDWSGVENAPEVKGVNVFLVGNNSLDARAERRMSHQEFEAYLSTLTGLLNQKVQSQKEELIMNGEVQLELSSEIEKNLACDLVREQVDLTFELDVIAESAKVLDHFWIRPNEFQALYDEVSKSVKDAPMSVFEAGMLVGAGFERLKANVDAFKNDRDVKLMKGLFRVHADKTLSLKKLIGEDFKTEFASLPEINLQHWSKPEKKIEIGMSALHVYPEK